MRRFGRRGEAGWGDRGMRDEEEALAGRGAARVVDERRELPFESVALAVHAVEHDDGIDVFGLRLTEHGEDPHVTRTPRTDRDVSCACGCAATLAHGAFDFCDDLRVQATARKELRVVFARCEREG